MNEPEKEKVAHLWCGNCGSDITDCPEHVLFGCKPKVGINECKYCRRMHCECGFFGIPLHTQKDDRKYCPWCQRNLGITHKFTSRKGDSK